MSRFQIILNRVGADKVLHFETCALIVLGTYVIIRNAGVSFPLSYVLPCLIGLVAGVAKEVYDKLSGGAFDWNDIIADMLGAAFGLFVTTL